MKRKTLLTVWILAMLFPLNRVRRDFPFIRQNLDFFFGAEWIHLLGHLFLFAGLALLLWFVFKFPFNTRSALMIAALVLLVGGVQEVLQLQVKGRGFGWPEVFDLSVDLNGAALGIVLAWMISNRKDQAARGITPR